MILRGIGIIRPRTNRGMRTLAFTLDQYGTLRVFHRRSASMLDLFTIFEMISQVWWEKSTIGAIPREFFQERFLRKDWKSKIFIFQGSLMFFLLFFRDGIFHHDYLLPEEFHHQESIVKRRITIHANKHIYLPAWPKQIECHKKN